jgi:hypothetical protein
MDVNDNAFKQVQRGVLESIASKLAPTGCVWPDMAHATKFVGAGLPAMDINDNAFKQVQRGVLESIASKLAPTGFVFGRM